MDRDMRRGAFVSFSIHALLILAAIIVLPVPHLDSAADSEVDVQFVGPSQPQHALKPNKVAAVDNTAVAHNAARSDNAPKIKPIEAPPPPPPPPPPAPKQAALPKPPAPAPPPPPPVPTPSLAPTPPPPPPQPPQKTTSTVVQPKIPLPPIPQPPAPAQSPTHQQNFVKTPAQFSKTLLNTLQNLRAEQQQVKPPTHVYNPDQGGAPNGGGSPDSTANSQLSQADRDAIGSHVRPCWTIDGNAPNIGQLSVKLQVTTDASGTVHQAVVAPEDQDKLTDPIFAAFSQRAINAVMDYQCATLPLPPYMLGQPQTFLFNFSP